MTTTNLRLRGGTYHWRRKFTLAGTPVSVSFSLYTGSYRVAHYIKSCLEVQARNLIMSYGSIGVAIGPDQMKATFKDAMRVQLNRILTEQIGNGGDPQEDARANRVFAEFWDIRARRGIHADFTPADFDDLLAKGWSAEDASCVAALCHSRKGQHEISKRQLKTYASSFGIVSCSSNLQKMQRLIFEARAAACREATRQLPDSGFDFQNWIDEALQDDGPLAHETIIESVIDEPEGQQAYNEVDDAESTPTAPESVVAPECIENTDVNPRGENLKEAFAQGPEVAAQTKAFDHPSDAKATNKKLLKAAAEDCIAAVAYEDGWSPDTIKQVRTAIEMFDFACGANVYIEDLSQDSVEQFKLLCRALPNRWGRTTAERQRGFPASLERAKEMPASEIGISQKTMNKHLTWIAKVIKFSASASGGSHKTAEPMDFKSARETLTRKGGRKAMRKRDLRANWTTEQVRHILSAPIWSGSAGLDDRLSVGDEIFHDAWYYLPVMLPLYGGRSSELAGLRLADVHEDEVIPYMQIDYTEDRDLKNVQSIRKLPIHPELIRLGFIDYVRALRSLGHTYLFPEMKAAKSTSFANTFRKSVFEKLRAWAFPEGTEWRHRNKGAWIDKNVHSYRGMCTTILKGKVEDSVRCDIFGHEGKTETEQTYDEEAELADKLAALEHLSFLTEHIEPTSLRLRPLNRQCHGSRRGRPKKMA